MRPFLLVATLAVAVYGFQHWLVQTTASHGMLVSPPPRSYTTLIERGSLTNKDPCGGNAFATQYPSVNATYSNFLHQNVLDKTQYITEGGLLNVSWLPLFYSSNSSYYHFSLCMNTSVYGYSKCIRLSDYFSNETEFDLYLSEIDINPHNSGYNYHWTSITDRFSTLEKHILQHSLYIPDHLFHSLPILDTSDGASIPATLIFEWIVSDYQVIDNCADIIIYARSDDEEDHSTTVPFDDLTTPDISTLPGQQDGGTTNDVCTNNPNGTQYSKLKTANISSKCGTNMASCPYGQCCSGGVCGPYVSNVYEYYFNDKLLQSIPVFLGMANFGFLDALTASMSFCESNVEIDNRYIPNPRLENDGYDPNDFLDLCWKCNLDSPSECTYSNWFATNDTVAISNVYSFYDTAATSDSHNNGNSGGGSGGGSSSSGSDNAASGLLAAIVVLLVLTCCVFLWFFRTYKGNKLHSRATKMRLLDLEVDHMSAPAPNGNNTSNPTIDSQGQDDVTYGQHGYSDGSSDIDEHSKDPLDAHDDMLDVGAAGGGAGLVDDDGDVSNGDANDDDDDDDKVGGILGRASLDATSATDKSLPAGWEEYRTDAGERYYHHTEKNLTQWDRPE